MNPTLQHNMSPIRRASVARGPLLACLMALVMASGVVPAAAAKDAYVPYIESLEAIQQKGYIKAAPSGYDESEAEAELVMESIDALVQGRAVEDEDGESRLEQLAGEQKGPLTLDETQQHQTMASDLEQYGYDIFNREPSSFMPVSGIPVPQNYRIGPGDNIIVQLFGKRNVEYKLVVTRDGDILVPEYGPVKVAGSTFDEVEKLMIEGFERRVIGAKAVVTMGQLRSIQIRMTGEVVQPGIYTVGGLFSMIDALLTTGGVRRTGSLRQIQLIRDGKSIATFDMYNLLQRGISGGDLFLQHNDTIFVPPVGDIVYVGGEVQRPAIYELGNERTVGQVIAMAGGMLPTASLDHSLIERIQASGTRTLIDFSIMRDRSNDDAILRTGISNGDFLRILPLEDELEDVVLLAGHVKRPGGYQFREGMRVSDLLPTVDLLLPGADVDFLLIKREQASTLRTEIVYSNLYQVITNIGGPEDIALQPRDLLMVFNLAEQRAKALSEVVKELDIQGTDYRPARVVEARGAVRYAGRMPLEEDSRLLDVVSLAGGLKPGVELYYGVVARTMHPSSDIEVLPFKIAAASFDSESDANLPILPGDRLYFFDDKTDRSKLMATEIERLREQASYGSDEKLITILGEIMHPGTYPLVPGMRASDLLCAARGLTRKAYGLGAELSRVQGNLSTDNTVQHIALDSAVLMQICELGRLVAKGDASEAVRSELSRRYADDQLNPVLTPMDQVSFSEKTGWVENATVTLRGEVSRPGVYAIDRDETLCHLMQRAGGITQDAYSFGAEFTRISVREMQQETLDELQDQLDDLMVELSLSHSYNNEDKSAPEWAGKQDYLRTIRQLKRAKATGRMVVNLDKVVKCKDEEEDVVLQNGDTLTVPSTPDYVQVAGQVYVPTSHFYRNDRNIEDYVELSGGHTVLGRLKDTYVIQANGEVLNYRGSRTSSRIARKTVQPGARIYVPINVDRMNGTEKAQSWVSSLIQSAILAGIIL
ncbi:MAG: polysaccharide export outer membrane protein [Halioglobus sp.]|jgi:polysaccharide export outer membrane protein